MHHCILRSYLIDYIAEKSQALHNIFYDTKFHACGFFYTGIPGGKTSFVPRYAGYAGYDGDSAGHDIDSVSSAKNTSY